MLDAVGPLYGDLFHPGRCVLAMRALHSLGPEAGKAALVAYAASHPEAPSGLFAVARGLCVPPPEAGFLRPPALSAPSPPQPDDLRLTPLFPVFFVGDLPLSAVDVALRSFKGGCQTGVATDGAKALKGALDRVQVEATKGRG